MEGGGSILEQKETKMSKTIDEYFEKAKHPPTCTIHRTSDRVFKGEVTCSCGLDKARSEWIWIRMKLEMLDEERKET